jgi:hypothetical protein
MKSYCTQNDGDCQTCSLVNYGRDCYNNPIDEPDTTGQLVFAYCGHYLLKSMIAVDEGHYPDTKAELNVRKLNILHDLSVGLTHPTDTMQQVAARDGSYGCGWGETSKLHPLTKDEADRILAEIKDRQAEEQAHKAAMPAAKPSAMDEMVCPHCGTVCYGDCQAR